MQIPRKLPTGALLALCLVLAACGGGGGGSAPAAPTPAAASPSPASGANVQPISVDAGLGGNVNLAFTSVTLCAPGNSADCQTIDNIVVDTGSSGLRVLASTLSATLALTQQLDASGNPLVECAHFVNGYTWGPVKIADLKIAGEQANSLPIQVIGDPNFATVPAGCVASGGAAKNTAADLRANGILGVSVFRQDCGSACTTANRQGIYYACSAAGCQQTAVPLANQLQNPVTLFAADNNGTIIQLPAVPAGGVARVAGSLLFGIGTQANNSLGAANVIGVDRNSGNFTTLYKGSNYSASFLDSGSNGLFFSDNIAVCANGSAAPGFYCPGATLALSATIQGANGASATVPFNVGDAATLFANAPGFAAFGELAGPFAANSFDWGLAFFYGRSVYTAIEGASTPGGTGPYVAF